MYVLLIAPGVGNLWQKRDEMHFSAGNLLNYTSNNNVIRVISYSERNGSYFHCKLYLLKWNEWDMKIIWKLINKNLEYDTELVE